MARSTKRNCAIFQLKSTQFSRPHSACEGRRISAALFRKVAGVTGLEPAASGVTGQRSNQLSYTPISGSRLPPGMR